MMRSAYRHRRSQIRLVAAAAVALATVAVSSGAAQTAERGTVRGTVHMLERGAKSSKDLADAVVYLVPESNNGLTRMPPETKVVNMNGREFEPHVQIVRVGGRVTYPNRDPFSHNVFSNSALGAFDLGLYRTGASRSTVFDRAGVYAIYCNIHARMVNFVIAVNTPYVTRVDRKGAFELSGVPEGTYRMHVWHERAPEVLQTITVSETEGTVVSASLDARSFLAAAHTDKFGKAYASTRADRY